MPLLFFLIAMVAISPPALGQEAEMLTISGRVLSFDRQQGLLEVQPLPPAGEEAAVVLVRPACLPRWLKVGSQVRIQGYFDERHIFQATGPGLCRGRHDRTGVRSRLRKQCRPGHGRP
ncbi:MAG: hypothetical protein ABFR97_04040 [Thermodesulfobacteriota bacterium]